MDMLIHALKAFCFAALVFEVLLVLFMIAVGVSMVLEDRRQKNETRVAKHRATQESRLETAKRVLREEKERIAREDSFFGDWSYLLNGEEIRMSEDTKAYRRQMDEIADTQNIKVFTEEL